MSQSNEDSFTLRKGSGSLASGPISQTDVLDNSKVDPTSHQGEPVTRQLPGDDTERKARLTAASSESQPREGYYTYRMGDKVFEFELNALEHVDHAVVLVEMLLRDHPDPGAKQVFKAYPTFIKSLDSGETTKSRSGVAYRIIENGVRWISDQEEDKPRLLSTLARYYSALFQTSGDPLRISKAIEFDSQANLLTPNEHPEKHAHLTNLKILHYLRYNRMGNLDDLNSAIDYYTQLVLLTSEAHPKTPFRLSSMGGLHRTRFVRLGNIDDLERAINYQSRAASLTRESHPERPEILRSLGESYATRFLRLGELADLRQAVRNSTEAVSLTSDDNDNRKPEMLGTLGNILLTRFNHMGDMSDLNCAISHLQKSVSLAPPSLQNRPGLLDKLGRSLRTRFEYLNDLADIDAAIEHQTQAISLTLNGDPSKLGYLTNLGASLIAKFRRLHDLVDVEKAIEYQSRAIDLFPEGHPDKAICFGSLGNSYGARVQYYERLSDLENQIRCYTQAVQLTPDQHTSKAMWLINLGSSLDTRFKLQHKSEDIGDAISYQKQALALTPSLHPKLPNIFHRLGDSYRSRFNYFGEQADIDTAIAHQSQASTLLDDRDPFKTIVLTSLGNSHLDRFKRLGDNQSLDQAILYFQKAAQSQSGIPLAKMQAAHSWATSSLLSPDRSPLPGFKKFVDLIPQLVWLGGSVDNRYTKAFGLCDYTAEAAAAAIQLQEYDLALEWMEQGSSIVWRQMLQLRTPLDDLRSTYPELAKSLQETAHGLDQASTRAESNSDINSHASENVAPSHHRLAETYEKLLGQVRALPGFSDFMHPKKASALKASAQHSTVVVINVHYKHCDALVLLQGSGNIIHVPLSRLSHEAVKAARGRLSQFLRESSLKQRGIKSSISAGPDIMEMLWKSVVEPVFEHLGYLTTSPGSELPHITWCTSGPLAFLPLHAAGSYNEPRARVFNYAISSYTPTLSALLASPPDPSKFHGILAVGQANAPNLPPLPGTNVEIALVKQQAGTLRVESLTAAQASVLPVMRAMEEYSWIHMACHASQNRADPTRSAFHLHDGALELATMMQKSLKDKGLAFLSACETATGDDDMPSEAVHLAAGMLMAGYPSVIATMWSIQDEDAPLITEKVYAQLLEGGVADTRNTAKALHNAVGCLRANLGEKEFARWVPYIHIGL